MNPIEELIQRLRQMSVGLSRSISAKQFRAIAHWRQTGKERI